MYPLKGTSVDRVCVVFGTRVDLGFFTIRQERIRGRGAFAEGNSAPFKQRWLLLYNIASVSRIARRYIIQCSVSNTHAVHIELDGGRQAGQRRSEEGWRM